MSRAKVYDYVLLDSCSIKKNYRNCRGDPIMLYVKRWPEPPKLQKRKATRTSENS
jgi:hypothetical protein